MKWKNIKLRNKFLVAFGILIGLLVFISWGANFGIGNIVDNADETINGNKLRTDLSQKYVQHLKWAQDVNKLLTDPNVTQLNVQTDPYKCAFGQWYYGEGRKIAEELAPELKPLFDEFEVPHKQLHQSAIKIQEVFVQSDFYVGSKIREIKSDHLIWMHNIKDAMLQRKNGINVQTDFHKCNLGKWLKSEEMLEMRKNDPEFNSLMAQIDEPHEQLHSSAIRIDELVKSGNYTAAYNYFNNNTSKNAIATLDKLDKVLEWHDKNVEGMIQANKIYNDETLIYLAKMGELFDKVIERSKDYILTDEVMLNEATKTRFLVTLFSVIAVIIAIVFAIIIARGIIIPINRGVKFAKEVSEGNLLAKVDIDQEDEIGVLASSLTRMTQKLQDIVANIRQGAENIASSSLQMSSSSQQMSQGASEQASSAEEVSSSMEEMASNIQQNTDNAQQTEKIALSASEGMAKVAGSARESVESTKLIAEKITIVNDIAFQTNILALNAAVEAARAGEHGKGFAVVAAEVRKLAERSKIAADEINGLSSRSLKVTEEAGQLMTQIIPEIEKTAKLVQEISAASLEQNSGAEQVNNALQQLNQVTQQNAAASEEMATSSEELAGQANQLKELISYFKTNNKESFLSVKQIEKKLHEFVPNIEELKAPEIEKKLTKEKGIEILMNDSMDSEFESF